MATAEHPAMLFYLDNFQSVGPDSPAGQNGGRGRGNQRFRRRFGPAMQTDGLNAQQANRPKRGLNENYARELMELHTLGVGRGYTQKDVTEIGKVVTGWDTKQARRGGGLQLNER